jgi:trans-2,3-dihydro-3-hydroxyanthranilate isomerase
MPLSYLHYDVFTAKPLLGNQLAVFTNARGVDTAHMQAIAREMNFSESTFILPNERPDTDIRMRIFTPFNEMPMAGHPTIGSTFALAHSGVIKKGAKRVVFGLNIGPTPVDLERTGRRRSVRSSRSAPRVPTRLASKPRTSRTRCPCRKCRAASRISSSRYAITQRSIER